MSEDKDFYTFRMDPEMLDALKPSASGMASDIRADPAGIRTWRDWNREQEARTAGHGKGSYADAGPRGPGLDCQLSQALAARPSRSPERPVAPTFAHRGAASNIGWYGRPAGARRT